MIPVCIGTTYCRLARALDSMRVSLRFAELLIYPLGEANAQAFTDAPLDKRNCQIVLLPPPSRDKQHRWRILTHP